MSKDKKVKNAFAKLKFNESGAAVVLDGNGEPVHFMNTPGVKGVDGTWEVFFDGRWHIITGKVLFRGPDSSKVDISGKTRSTADVIIYVDDVGMNFAMRMTKYLEIASDTPTTRSKDKRVSITDFVDNSESTQAIIDSIVKDGSKMVLSVFAA
tara:strand:- start:232 stop:690 length:459 start_codon:yes stop_codon:yes gene_type:complete